MAPRRPRVRTHKSTGTTGTVKTLEPVPTPSADSDALVKKTAGRPGRRGRSSLSKQTPTSGSVVAKKKAVVKKQVAPVKKRAPNQKETDKQRTGLGIGHARVKNVLNRLVLHPDEWAARDEITKGANKPHRPKKTTDNPNPEMPEQGPQVPVSKMSKSTRDIVADAEAARQRQLLSNYVSDRVRKIPEDKRKLYYANRKAAVQKHRVAQKQLPPDERKEFDLESFNKNYDSEFYDDFKNVHDDLNDPEKHTEWSRATNLISKQCTKVSTDAHLLLTAFLDQLVLQMADNGLRNCHAKGRKIVKVQHVLPPRDSVNGSDKIPLWNWLRTFDSTANAYQFLHNKEIIQAQAAEFRKKNRPVEVTDPVLSETNHKYRFDSYATDLCRHRRMELADSESKELGADKASAYHDINTSNDFKTFCTEVIIEAIYRVGEMLHNRITSDNHRTITLDLMEQTICAIHTACGMDYNTDDDDPDNTYNTIFNDFDTYQEYCRKRKEDNAERDNANDSGDEDAAEYNDEDSVTVE